VEHPGAKPDADSPHSQSRSGLWKIEQQVDPEPGVRADKERADRRVDLESVGSDTRGVDRGDDVAGRVEARSQLEAAIVKDS
jgi:hypothetical protein